MWDDSPKIWVEPSGSRPDSRRCDKVLCLPITLCVSLANPTLLPLLFLHPFTDIKPQIPRLGLLRNPASWTKPLQGSQSFRHEEDIRRTWLYCVSQSSEDLGVYSFYQFCASGELTVSFGYFTGLMTLESVFHMFVICTFSLISYLFRSFVHFSFGGGVF